MCAWRDPRVDSNGLAFQNTVMTRGRSPTETENWLHSGMHGSCSGMPLYEYHCEPCDLTFECLIRTAGDEAHCPRCSSADVAKQLSVPAMAQTSGARAGGLPISAGASGAPAFGCGRPQCGSGVCAGLD